MSEPRKLAVIGYCAQCPHYQYGRTRNHGACLLTNPPLRIAFGFAPIPAFCPLPDAPEPEVKS